jgi:predicted transcriptional regulator
MSEPLDDVAFLTRSSNRVAVARTLAAGPHSRRELVAETDGSRVTVGRILHDFEERGWVDSVDTLYQLTTRGRLVVQGVETLFDRLAALDRLDPVLPWFAVDRLDVPVESFVDADVTVPTGVEPNRHHQRIGTLGAAAASVRMYSQGVTSEALHIHLDAVREGQRLTLLLTDDVLDTARENARLRTDLAALAETDGTVGRVTESLLVPFVGLFDGRCVVGIGDDQDRPVGIVESDDDAVVAWAERTIDDLDAAAVEVGPAAFTV